MAGKNEAKIKFTADTTEFSSQIKNANSAMSALRAGMQLNDAQFKNTGNSAEYLKQKQQLLTAQIEQSQAKQEALNGKLQAAQKYYGEDSAEAQRLATQLTRAQTEEEKLKTALNQTNQELDEQSADLDETSADLNEAANAAKRAGDAAEEGKGGWTSAKAVFANLASGAITAVINKLKEAAVEVVRLGSEFTASLSNVQALSGATSAEMSKLEATAKELGRSTIFSASQVSDAFGYMALAGWDTEQMLSGVDGVLNLAAASNMDLAKASDIVTDYLTAFGLSAEDSGKFVDQMSYAMANSNTNTEQLGEAYKNVAATAASMGYSVEDTTAVLMTMANAGVKGGEAGTGLSTIMTRLATNTKNCADELEEYGVEVYNSDGKMNSLSSILEGLSGIWGDLTDEQQANLSKTIAGTSQFSKFQTIMQGVSDTAAEGGQSFYDYAEALENCDGTAQEMSDTMQDNLSGDMNALGSAAEGLGLQLFDYFEGPLRSAAQGAADMLNKITDAITPQRSELQNFISEIDASNESVRGSLDAAQEMISGATANVGELEAYKNVILDINSKTEKSEFDHYQLKNAVDALKDTVPGLEAAYDETNGTLNLTNSELEALFNNAEAVAMQNAILKAKQADMDAYAEAVINAAKAESAVNKAQEEMNEYMAANPGSQLTDTMGNANMEMGEYASTLQNAKDAQDEANQAVEDAKAAIDDSDAALQKVAEDYGLTNEQIQEMADSQDQTAEATEEATDVIEEGAQSAEAELEALAASVGMTADEFEQFKEGVRDSMQSSIDMMNEFEGGAKITADEILANLQSQQEGLATWSENMATLGAAAGSGMTTEFYNYLLEMGPQSANLVQTLVDTLGSDSEKFAEICSTWGAAMNLSNNADALAEGGAAASSAIASGVESGTSAIVEATAGAGEEAAKNLDMSGASKNVESDLAGVKKSADGAKKSVSDATKGIQTSINNDMTRAASLFSTKMDTIKSKASSAMNSAKSSVTGAMNSIRSAVNVTISGPHVKVPHWRMNGRFNAETGSVPTISMIGYWAKGGIFTKPTFFNTPYGAHVVGEAGAEAVLPIDNLREYVSDAVETAGGGNHIDVTMYVDGSRSPEAWAADFAKELKQQMRIS